MTLISTSKNRQPKLAFPITALPKKIQQIIIELNLTDNYREEYLATSMLGAAATAIGNGCRLRIKSSWITPPALYMAIVGHAGNGKTHPLKAALEPLYEIQAKRFEDYERQMKMRRKGEPMPVLRQIILNDYTSEAMKQALNANPQGIAIVYDELLGMFKNTTRYNSGSAIEDFLSAFNSQPIVVNRVSEMQPMCIKNPCLTIIGTIQTDRIPELITKDNLDCGLIDRFLFVIPQEDRLQSVGSGADNLQLSQQAKTEWSKIINKIINYPTTVNSANTANPAYSINPAKSANSNAYQRVISFDTDARKRFYEWDKALKQKAEELRQRGNNVNRYAKADMIVARLALIIQKLAWACGESYFDSIDINHVESAIKIYEYFETCYNKLTYQSSRAQIEESDNDFLEIMPDSFTSREAVEIAHNSELRLSQATGYRRIEKLYKSGLLLKAGNFYVKSLSTEALHV